MATIYLKSRPPSLGRVDLEAPDTIRKRGSLFRLRREVEAMEFVRSRTSIPVPQVLDAHLVPNEKDGEDTLCWIIMERLPGEQLDAAWPKMSEGSRAEMIRQLKSYFEQLHSIRCSTDGEDSAPGWIGSCSHGPAYDHRTCGPFASVSEFNDFIVAPIRDCPKPELVAKYRSQLSDSYGVMFAHADVSWENVLVDCATGRVTGILDWEMAGFWPEWWEYRKALFGDRSQPWWINIVKEIMQEYPDVTETDMDIEMF